jgi:hypothetical protein
MIVVGPLASPGPLDSVGAIGQLETGPAALAMGTNGT